MLKYKRLLRIKYYEGNSMIDKVVRIFISSTQCLLIEDRQTIINTVLQHGAFPIAQEYDFQASNAVMPISKCEEKVEMADAIILVINAWYGSIVQENGERKKCAGCKIKDSCPYAPSIDGKDNSNGECQISYTHYEYLYANYIGKGENIYVLMRDGIIGSNNKVDNKMFVNELTRCQKECKRLKKKCSSCQQDLADIPSSFYNWIETITAHMRSTYIDEKTLITEIGRFTDLIKRDLGDSNQKEGLYPYSEFLKINTLANLYELLREKAIENLFNWQFRAIEDAEISRGKGTLYLKDAGDDRPLIRVLCFRGNSFVNGSDALWEKYIFSRETKHSTIEFLLADLDNEEILKRRWQSFPRYDTYDSFRKSYKGAMTKIQELLSLQNKEFDCQLYLHNESNLPFRMLFIGNSLYLSFFLNNTPAADSPVYKTTKGSSLYMICEEYYNRVKEQSKKVTGGNNL
ncbi:MAG: DUF4062 domain-containing protein [Bacilli bacterium]|nr:DUF4062 domain-containing protein [Bacilli bacterium]